VFDFVADERNEPRYNPQMTLAEMVTQGPIGVGGTFHSVMTGARAADMTIEFTEFDRLRRLVAPRTRQRRIARSQFPASTF
jgi:hypothetical protein